MSYSKYTYQREISVKAIYGTDSPEIPRGYEATEEFRPPVKGDIFRDPEMCFANYNNLTDWADSAPRIILKKVKKYRFVCDDVTPRVPKKGEWVFRAKVTKDVYVTAGSEPFQLRSDWADLPHNYVAIFRREEVT